MFSWIVVSHLKKPFEDSYTSYIQALFLSLFLNIGLCVVFFGKPRSVGIGFAEDGTPFFWWATFLPYRSTFARPFWI